MSATQHNKPKANERRHVKRALPKTYRIVETCVYELQANSLESAERIFLNAPPAERDGSFMIEVADREIYELDEQSAAWPTAKVTQEGAR